MVSTVDSIVAFKAFRHAVKELETSGERARKILMALSDPTTDPISEAKGKSACGAWPGEH